MFDIGGGEVLFLLVMTLLLLGPRHLPRVARAAARATTYFRRVTADLRTALDEEIRIIEREEKGDKAEPSIVPDNVARVRRAKRPGGETWTTDKDKPRAAKLDDSAPIPRDPAALNKASAPKHEPSPGDEAAFAVDPEAAWDRGAPDDSESAGDEQSRDRKGAGGDARRDERDGK
ncbi:twin-arginine translocase TatA/TatE family subunit [bacterium]|nr:twin-arginine translocase TatA/TatE family subunit [bacterium]